MSTQSSTAERPTSNRLRFVELVYWIGAGTLTVTAAGVVLAVVVANNVLVGLKYYLFVVGFLMFGLGSLAIQPKSPRLNVGEENGRSPGTFRMPVAKLFSFSMDGDTELWFEERIQELPPLRERPLALGERVSRNTKLFVTSLAVLGLSFALEAVLGVTA